MTDETNALRDRIRRLESDNADLRRDYAELVALDPDGLQAKVVALHAEVADGHKYVAQLRATIDEELDRSAEYYRRATAAEFAANPAVIAHDLANLREERDAFRDNLRAALADVERLAGASVAEVLIERRREIRDITGRLNDALALVDRAKVAARTFVIANDAADGATAMMDDYSNGERVPHDNPHAVRDAAYETYKAARKALESMIGGES